MDETPCCTNRQTHTRSMLAERDLPSGHPWSEEGGGLQRGTWPAHWIRAHGAKESDFVAAYRLRFTVGQTEVVRVYVTADERYDLFLDGTRIGRGPERGDPRNWYFQTFDLRFSAGEHVLVARVWSQGLFKAPWSHLGLRHGFLLAAHDPARSAQFDTGTAPWQARILSGIHFVGSNKSPVGPGWAHPAWATHEMVDGADFAWDATEGGGEGWGGVERGSQGKTLGVAGAIHSFEHSLRPGSLPSLSRTVCRPGRVVAVETVSDGIEGYARPYGESVGEAEVRTWQEWWSGTDAALTVPRRRRLRVLIDLENYYNAYIGWRASGGTGARIGVDMAERLRTRPDEKAGEAPRGRWKGAYWASASATWTLPGGAAIRQGETLWWRAGRYLQIAVETGEDDLKFENVWLEETRFPLDDDAGIETSDPGLDHLFGQCTRALQCCMHETFMDCPWYEQQFWVGDARVQMLLSHVLSPDDRLIRRCLAFLADTRWAEGPVLGRYPAPQQLSIPGFALAFCGMVHDFAMWRGDREFVGRLMPAARGTLDFVMRHRSCAEAPVVTPFGWHYTDWVSGWHMGEPPGSHEAPSAVFNWWVVGLLRAFADIEEWLGEPELGQRRRRMAAELSEAAVKAFWDREHRRFSENPGGGRANEHAQVMAVLSGLCPEAYVKDLRGTLSDPAGLDPTGLYFDHYHFSALARLGMEERWWQKLERYRDFAALGLMTTPESAGPTRSDCHAWSAHPRLHAVTDLMGVGPAEFGFTRARMAPCLGCLQHLEVGVPTPAGMLRAEARRVKGGVRICLESPVPVDVRTAEGTVGIPAGRSDFSVQ